jgi:hypothetical protein
MDIRSVFLYHESSLVNGQRRQVYVSVASDEIERRKENELDLADFSTVLADWNASAVALQPTLGLLAEQYFGLSILGSVAGPHLRRYLKAVISLLLLLGTPSGGWYD